MRNRRRVFETQAEADRFMPENGQVFMVKEGNQLRVGYNDVRGGWYMEGQPIFDLGFGPQVPVKGDVTLGLFGEITESELFTQGELVDANGLTAGNLLSPSVTWLKILYKEKVLFVAKHPIRRNLSWDSLYKVGSVFGVDDPAISMGNPDTNQLVTLTKENSTFNLRSLTGQEWRDIFPSLLDGTLATYQESDILGEPYDIGGNYRYYTGTLTQDVSTTDQTTTVYGTGSNLLDSRKVWRDINGQAKVRTSEERVFLDSDTMGVVMCWRPVLELVHDIHIVDTTT